MRLRGRNDVGRLPTIVELDTLDGVPECAVCGVVGVPLFTPGAGRDETALLIAGHVLHLCGAVGVDADPRLATVVETGEKALRKKGEVETARTVEDVEGLSWT